jgi:hypothetical protein
MAVMALVASSAAAFAEAASHHDAIGDAYMVNTGKAQPLWKPGDITAIRVAHREHRVTVRLTFRDLRHWGSDYNIDFEPPHATPDTAFRLSGSNDPPTRPNQGTWLLRSGEDPVAINCAGLRHRIDCTLNQVSVSVPRRCIGTPTRVRVAASVETSKLLLPEGEVVLQRIDVAYTNRPGYTKTFGPFLGRG